MTTANNLMPAIELALTESDHIFGVMYAFRFKGYDTVNGKIAVKTTFPDGTYLAVNGRGYQRHSSNWCILSEFERQAHLAFCKKYKWCEKGAEIEIKNGIMYFNRIDK
jgi:hypothetical protein